ncbi:hydroxyphenylacetyl-CoA thioesterase PaaI [Bacillus carboniphilus]|uniref:Hydroxyphenylacetyl-CoA thioesterase PaaI n=1 Tax=Bacillus carboniphilus TaxID=86663 RepID=A0ABP3G123_9BACI
MRDAIIERVTADPYAKSLGIEIVKVEEGLAKVTMTIQEHMLNFHGAANGGVIFSLADVAFAIASNSYGQTAVGINVNINYMKAGMVGDILTATATEVSKNPKLGLYRMVVTNQHGEFIASADGMVYRKKELFG